MASKRVNEGFVKRFRVCGNSRSRGVLVFSKRANEGGTVLDLPGEMLNLPARRVCIFGSKRGCLHVESAIDSYEEVILPLERPQPDLRGERGKGKKR